MYPNMDMNLYKFFKKNRKNNVVNNDWYLQLCSTRENIYKFYLKYKDTVDAKVVNKLSYVLANYDIAKIGNEFVKHREFYNFPTLIESENMIYGNDFSFLEMKNRYFKDSHFKMIYFVGVEFNNVVFSNCSFSCCVFTGSNINDVVFNNCTFSECSCYNTPNRYF
jgi:uncharacterized protein YjbI with pentapeptide repeats